MLIKALIVEDEMIVRVGIKSMIAWNEIGYELVGEAANGEQALTLVDQYKPDVVITDIRMPEMNGIELMRQLRNRSDNIQVIILSCHNDFKYVQQALKLGAVDYILKLSMQPEEMMRILVRLRNDRMKLIEERRKLEQKMHISAEVMKKQLIMNMLDGKFMSASKWNEEVRNWSINLAKQAGVMVCRIKEFESPGESGLLKRKELMLFSVANVAHDILKSEHGGEVVEYAANEIVILANCADAAQWEEKSGRLAEKIEGAIRQYLKLTISIGIAPCLSLLPFAAEQWTTAREHLEYAVFYDKESVAALPTSSEQSERLLAWKKETVQEIVAEIKAKHTAGVQRTLKDLMSNLKEWQPAPDDVRAMLKDLLLPFYRLSGIREEHCNNPTSWKRNSPEEAIRSLKTIDHLEEWFMYWIVSYMEPEGERLRSEVAQVRSYIHRNYRNKISIADIAYSIGISESYLSHLYKKETGENLIDYLTKHRLEKAKILLRETDLRTYEIAEAIGFSEANYFSKQFKRYEGMNPIEYRNQFSKNNPDLSNRNTD